MPGGDVGHDKEGSIIRVVPWGDLDMKGLMLSCRKLDFVKSKIVQFEQTMKDITKMTEKVSKIYFVLYKNRNGSLEKKK